jgi:hypothetical protein
MLAEVPMLLYLVGSMVTSEARYMLQARELPYDLV